MNKINIKCKIGAVAFLLGGLSGCEGVLDVQPEGRIDLDEIFSSNTTTESYLNGCYQNFPAFGLGYYWYTNALASLTDDCWDNDYTLENFVLAYDDKITSATSTNKLIYDSSNFASGSLSSWDLYYRNIGRCNTFLSRIGTAVVDSEEKRELLKSEARILRAFYYMELIGRFGSACIFTEPIIEGEEWPELKKSSFKDCADFIISECDDVITNSTNLQWKPSSDSDHFRMNKAIACAIKSRVALFMASPLFCEGNNYWEEAEKYTKEALTACLDNGYALYTMVKSPSIFGTNAYYEFMVSQRDYGASAADLETIFYTYGNNMAWNIQGCPVNAHIKSGMCPTQELVDAFPMKTGKYIVDVLNPYLDEKHLEPNYVAGSGYDENNPYDNREERFYATILYNGATVKNDKNVDTKLETYQGGNCEIRLQQRTHTITGYYNRKYRHPNAYSGHPVSSAPLRYFRLAELYLNYAEAAVENGHLAEAIEAVSPIRERVHLPNIEMGDQASVRAEVRHERRLEYPLEELHYYDIRRWTEPTEDMSVGHWLTGMWIEKVNGKLEYHRFTIGDVYNADTKTWAGSGRERQCYKRKYLLHPLEETEASRLKATTGVDWQNPGW